MIGRSVLGRFQLQITEELRITIFFTVLILVSQKDDSLKNRLREGEGILCPIETQTVK